MNGFYNYNNNLTHRISNRIKCLTYYLKCNGYSVDYIINTITPFIKEMNEYNRHVDIAIKYSINIINEEFNRNYNNIKFSKNEISLIKELDLSTGRILFFILCYTKMYNINCINVSPRRIKSCYNDIIFTKSADLAIAKIVNMELLSCEIYFKCKLTVTDTLLNLYDDDIVYEFKNISNINMLFDYVIGRYPFKKYGFCEHCGEIFEKNSNNQKFDSNCKIINRRNKVRKNVNRFRNKIM